MPTLRAGALPRVRRDRVHPAERAVGGGLHAVAAVEARGRGAFVHVDFAVGAAEAVGAAANVDVLARRGAQAQEVLGARAAVLARRVGALVDVDVAVDVDVQRCQEVLLDAQSGVVI